MIRTFFQAVCHDSQIGQAGRWRMTLQVGQLIDHDRYLIETHLGQGGMGTVYLAWDRNLEIKVALKENLTTSPEARKQFLKEAQILARLSHPNLPRVTDYFSLPDQGQYLVMDFVEGDDLQSLLRRNGRLTPEQVLPWMRQIGDALAYLHGQPSPIVHRDIKPGNIKIRPDGRAMLVDFGIAKIYDPEQLTTGGARAFTPGYSPPEQYGEGTTDPRSDVYAFGATIYHLLTGFPPPDGVRRMLKQEKLIPPSQWNQAIDAALEQALLRSMELEPEQRFQSVQEFARALFADSLQGKELPSRPAVSGAPARSIAGSATISLPSERPTEPMESPDLPETDRTQIPPAPPRVKNRLSLGLVMAAFVLVCGILSYATYTRLAAFSASGGTITATFASQRVTPGGGSVALGAGPSAATPTAQATLTSPPPSDTPLDTPLATTESLTAEPSPSPVPVGSPSFSYQVMAQILPAGRNASLRGVAAKNGYVYLLSASGELDAYDLSSFSPGNGPAQFRQPVASLQINESAGLLLNQNLLYAYGKNGLDVVDITDPAAPELVDAVDGPSANNLILYENHLIAPGDGQIALYDFSLLGTPVLSATFSGGKNQQFYGAAVDQNRLYVSERLPSPQASPFLHVLDYSDPADMREIQAVPLSSLAVHILVDNSQLILCAASDVQLWDLSAPDLPAQTSPATAADGRACLLDSGIVLTGDVALWASANGLQVFSTYAENGKVSNPVPLDAVMMDEFALITKPDRVLVLAAVSN